MRCLTLCLWLAAASFASAWGKRPRNYDTHDYYALHIDSTSNAVQIAEHLRLEHEGQLAEIPEHHVFSALKHDNDIVEEALQELKIKRRKRDIGSEWHPLDSLKFNQKQVLRKRLVKREVPSRSGANAKRQDPPPGAATVQRQHAMKTLGIADPIFEEQWHLYNVDQPGNDMNVTGVWLQGITGKNATVCIIDDGLDMDSQDLAANYFAKGSYDFNDKVEQPKPRLVDDRHGTRCAGEVAAVRNDVCG
ncbi:hypothetical protein LTS18_008069, partial [Coniosporium uncinatum]